MNSALTHEIADALGVGDLRLSAAGGGCISRGMLAESGGQRWFIKINTVSRFAMFEAEADGLSALAACDAFRVPQIAALGQCGDQAWLALEYLDMRSLRAAQDGETFAQALVALHRHTHDRFGWHRDNYIGSTPQENASASDWPVFFAEKRLQPQLSLARRNGASRQLIDDGERLCQRLPEFFAQPPLPSLLHGDLWGGNAAMDRSEKPAIFDPAVYFGDREADLAMTELFGGFPPAFYAAYHEAWPLKAGFERRKTLYNLYHVLNHFNLFGGGYELQAGQMIRSLL